MAIKYKNTEIFSPLVDHRTGHSVGVVGAGGEKPPATRLTVKITL